MFELRDPAEGVDELFVARWSPRAFQPGQIDQTVLTRLFDAARWSPSCFNEQPWRFYISTSSTFNDFLSLLVEGNQAWAQHASVIGFLCGRKNYDRNGKDNPYTRFDSGAAWMAMTLQARMEGLYTHGMGGIRHDAVSDYLNLDPQQEEVIMGFVIGRAVDRDVLDGEQKEKETPNGRKALTDIWRQI